MKKSIQNITKAILIVLPLFFIGCIYKTGINKTTTNTPVIILEKKECLGNCPVYTAKFFMNDSIKVYPKAHFAASVNSKGILKKKTTANFIKIAEEINFWELKDEYDNKNLMDIPATFLTINFRGKSKRIKIRVNAPKELVDLAQKIEKVVKTTNWTPLQ